MLSTWSNAPHGDSQAPQRDLSLLLNMANNISSENKIKMSNTSIAEGEVRQGVKLHEG